MYGISLKSFGASDEVRLLHVALIWPENAILLAYLRLQ